MLPAAAAIQLYLLKTLHANQCYNTFKLYRTRRIGHPKLCFKTACFLRFHRCLAGIQVEMPQIMSRANTKWEAAEANVKTFLSNVNRNFCLNLLGIFGWFNLRHVWLHNIVPLTRSDKKIQQKESVWMTRSFDAQNSNRPFCLDVMDMNSLFFWPCFLFAARNTVPNESKKRKHCHFLVKPIFINVK